MMTEYVEEESKTLQHVLVVVGSCFLALLLFLCVGKRKSRSSEDLPNISATVDINEVNINIVTVSTQAHTQPHEISVSPDVCTPQEITLTQAAPHHVEDSSVNNSQTFQLYDPSKNRRDPSVKSEHPYEKVIKPPTENSDESAQYSGSGNAENDNYARVRKVPKKEESAYLVVDIKEPSKNYDMINGDIVKLPVGGEQGENKCDVYDNILQKEQGENDSNEEEQENSRNSGFYASVVAGKQNELSVSAENSGNSGYYESCGPVTTVPVVATNTACGDVPSAPSIQDAYETIGSNKQNNTYDSVDLIKNSKKGKKKTQKNSKVKKDKEKTEKVKGGDEHTSHRRNIFKHTKKTRKSDGCITIEQEGREVVVANKSNSLPNQGKTSMLMESQRKSIAEIPPPPPSYDKLKHLTELRKARSRTSLHEGATSFHDGVSSVESSPRSSPRSADGNTNAQTGFTYMKKTSDPWRKSMEDVQGSEEVHVDEEPDESYCTVDSELKEKLISEKNAKKEETTTGEEISLTETNVNVVLDNENHVVEEIHVVGESDTTQEAAYASVDFEKKKRERQAVEFYAVVRKDSVNVNVDDGDSDGDGVTTYEASYSIIPDAKKVIDTSLHVMENVEPNYESIESTTVVSLPLVPTQG